MENLVANLYNQLYQLEKNVRKGKVYPIHKKLVFPTTSFQDIYDWLVANIALKQGSTVLDAGCGVGYGTCLLAEKCQVDITGISISEKEIAHAQHYSEQKGLVNQVIFEKKSFDQLPQKQYDTIIAVESVKHSLNLSTTLTSLLNALKPNGQLIIIEDFYLVENLTKDARQYITDWHLVDAFQLAHYHKTLVKEHCQLIDLTMNMPTKNKWVVNSKLGFTKLMDTFKGGTTNIHKIFKGGYYLDRLYLAKLMQYGVLIYTKTKENRTIKQ